MKQRLCLGRALIHDPGVLVLDEPAAGLDPRARIQLREMIRALAGHGKTVLVSSHILTELAEMCDLVGIIERGRLLAVGTVQEIQRGQQTRHAVRIQVRLLDDATGLANWLAQQDELEQIQTEGTAATFTHQADDETEATLLRSMIEAGFRVVAFGSQTKTLEEVFMQVTEGHVQ
jgi:ABC-2 type transport system ATP-binding protein